MPASSSPSAPSVPPSTRPAAVTFVADRSDVLTSVADVEQAAARIPHAEVVVLPGSHILTLEHPGRVQEALDALVQRSDLAPAPGPA